jgi:hypothetical protein
MDKILADYSDGWWLKTGTIWAKMKIDCLESIHFLGGYTE